RRTDRSSSCGRADSASAGRVFDGAADVEGCNVSGGGARGPARWVVGREPGGGQVGEGFVGRFLGGGLAGGKDGQQAVGAVCLGGLAGSGVGRTAKAGADTRAVGDEERLAERLGACPSCERALG